MATKVVVDCSATGAPSQEHIEALQREAFEAFTEGNQSKAQGIMEAVEEARKAASVSPFEILELTKEEEEQRRRDEESAKEQEVEAARAQRNSLLSASDWTQLPDTALDDKAQAEWRKYRQALRDLKFGGEEVKWPEAPGA